MQALTGDHEALNREALKGDEEALKCVEEGDTKALNRDGRRRGCI